jgi:hypothetical protein
MEGDPMAEKEDRDGQGAGIGEYEPPAVTPLGSVTETAGTVDDQFSAIDTGTTVS